MIGTALARDVHRALRVVRFNPGFTAMVVLTIAVGIGSTLTTFSAVDRLLLRGPDLIRDSDRVLRLYLSARPPGRPQRTTSTTGYVVYSALRENAHSLAAIAAYGSSTVITGRGADATPAMGGAATAGFFSLLGVRPAVGRVFTEEEDRPEAGAPVVVLDYDYWMRRYAGDASVVGHTLIIGDAPFTIIGILPRGFTGAGLSPVDFWVPVSAWQKPTTDWPTTWKAQWLTLIARLAPGVSSDAAGREATTIFRRAYPGPSPVLATAEFSLRPLTFTSDGSEPREAAVVRWLAAVAALVLVIACANVTNLMLARAIDRRREIALRLTLGSSPAGLLRLLASEAFVLTAAGGMGGALLALGGVTAIRRVFFPAIAWPGALLSPRLLLASILLTLCLGVLFALAPILEARRLALAAAIRGSAQDGGPAHTHLRDLLLVVQTALTIPLLVGAGLFIQSLRAIHSLDLGIQPERVLVGEISWPRLGGLEPAARSAEQVRRKAVYAELARSLAARRDVEHASLAVGLPFGYAFSPGVRVPGMDSIPTLPGGGPYVSAVTSDYFATVGTPIIRGRGFALSDGATTEPIAVISETGARVLWPNTDALDKCVLVGKDATTCARIVGIARDTHRSSLHEDASMQIYLPFGQENGFGGTVLLVRPRGDADRFRPALARSLTQIAPDARYPTVTSLQQAIDPQLRPWRAGAGLFGVFGAIALLVATVGLYSVLAYTVARRTRDFAIRLALGAHWQDVVTSALGRGLGAVAVGLAMGVALALAASRLMQPLLFDTSARNPSVFLVVVMTLVTVATIASLAPALRALGVDTQVLLRAE